MAAAARRGVRIAYVAETHVHNDYVTGGLELAAQPPTLPALRAAAARGPLLMVCASGNRSTTARERLAAAGIPAATLTGGTTAWSRHGHPVHRDGTASAAWPMERQVRLAAGSLVVTGLALGTRYRPARWLSAAIGGGLVFSALTDTCGFAVKAPRAVTARSIRLQTLSTNCTQLFFRQALMF